MGDLYIPAECKPLTEPPIYDGLLNVYEFPKDYLNTVKRLVYEWIPNTYIKEYKDKIVIYSRYFFPDHDTNCILLNNKEVTAISTLHVGKIEWKSLPIYIENHTEMNPAIICFFTRDNRELTLLSVEIYNEQLEYMGTYSKHYIVTRGTLRQWMIVLKNLFYKKGFYVKPKFNIELDTDAPVDCYVKFVCGV